MTLRTGAAGTRIAAWLAVTLSLVMSVVANAAFGINPGASLTGSPSPGKPYLLLAE